MKRIALLLIAALALAGCNGTAGDSGQAPPSNQPTASQTPAQTAMPEPMATATPSPTMLEPSIQPTPAPSVAPQPTETQPPATTAPGQAEETVAQALEYIRGDQGGAPESARLNWSESFLAMVDGQALYAEYIAAGGTPGGVVEFAEYMTRNAPAPKGWQQMTRDDILAAYGQEVERFALLEDGSYQVYVLIDGEEKPFAVVNSRTGYFHG